VIIGAKNISKVNACKANVIIYELIVFQQTNDYSYLSHGVSLLSKPFLG
jgi:hypothetical protein